MWPFTRRADRPNTVAPPAAGPAVPPTPAPPASGWRDVPTLARIISAPELISPNTRMQSALSSWQNPSYLLPLGHAITPLAPAGVVHDLPVPVPSAGSAEPMPVLHPVRRPTPPVAVARLAEPAASSPDEPPPMFDDPGGPGPVDPVELPAPSPPTVPALGSPQRPITVARWPAASHSLTSAPAPAADRELPVLTRPPVTYATAAGPASTPAVAPPDSSPPPDQPTPTPALVSAAGDQAGPASATGDQPALASAAVDRPAPADPVSGSTSDVPDQSTRADPAPTSPPSTPDQPTLADLAPLTTAAVPQSATPLPAAPDNAAMPLVSRQSVQGEPAIPASTVAGDLASTSANEPAAVQRSGPEAGFGTTSASADHIDQTTGQRSAPDAVQRDSGAQVPPAAPRELPEPTRELPEPTAGRTVPTVGAGRSLADIAQAALAAANSTPTAPAETPTMPLLGTGPHRPGLGEPLTVSRHRTGEPSSAPTSAGATHPLGPLPLAAVPPPLGSSPASAASTSASTASASAVSTSGSDASASSAYAAAAYSSSDAAAAAAAGGTPAAPAGEPISLMSAHDQSGSLHPAADVAQRTSVEPDAQATGSYLDGARAEPATPGTAPGSTPGRHAADREYDVSSPAVDAAAPLLGAGPQHPPGPGQLPTPLAAPASAERVAMPTLRPAVPRATPLPASGAAATTPPVVSRVAQEPSTTAGIRTGGLVGAAQSAAAASGASRTGMPARGMPTWGVRPAVPEVAQRADFATSSPGSSLPTALPTVSRRAVDTADGRVGADRVAPDAVQQPLIGADHAVASRTENAPPATAVPPMPQAGESHALTSENPPPLVMASMPGTAAAAADQTLAAAGPGATAGSSVAASAPVTAATPMVVARLIGERPAGSRLVGPGWGPVPTLPGGTPVSRSVTPSSAPAGVPSATPAWSGPGTSAVALRPVSAERGSAAGPLVGMDQPMGGGASVGSPATFSTAVPVSFGGDGYAAPAGVPVVSRLPSAATGGAVSAAGGRTAEPTRVLAHPPSPPVPQAPDLSAAAEALAAAYPQSLSVQRAPDGAVTLSAAAPEMPAAAPLVQPVISADVASSEPSGGGGGGQSPDQLLGALFDPLLRRLRAELRNDRERRGLLTDLRH